MNTQEEFQPFFDTETHAYVGHDSVPRWHKQGFTLAFQGPIVYRLVDPIHGNWISAMYCKQADGSYGVEAWEHLGPRSEGEWAPITRVATEHEAQELCVVAFVSMRMAGWSRETV